MIIATLTRPDIYLRAWSIPKAGLMLAQRLRRWAHIDPVVVYANSGSWCAHRGLHGP